MQIQARFFTLFWTLVLAFVPNVHQLFGQTRELVEQYSADENSVKFKYKVPLSSVTENRFTQFYAQWNERLDAIPWGDSLTIDQRIDLILLKNHISRQQSRRQTLNQEDQTSRRLLPYWKELVTILDAQQAMEPVDPRTIATQFAVMADNIDSFQDSMLGTISKSNPTIVYRTIETHQAFEQSLASFHKFHVGYDPLYTWWAKTPYENLRKKLDSHLGRLKASLGLDRDPEKIIGRPLGIEGLKSEIAFELIPYTPAELISIANEEMNWCDAEMRKAARELGFADWKKAQEFVKSKHVQPGEQPQMIRKLAEEATRFLEVNELVTVPKLAKEMWRMRMMSPERQKMSPYFLGGNTILISFPTGEMNHADKLMSMRGNNIHFARATVHHELIPGHHLQYFMNARHKPYRKLFQTPFWLEGWAVHWEMFLWDLDFARSPEDRIGMLFWRKHRCARIIFSLAYHSNEMTPDECIDFLVDRVGHERNNATAEVRRSIMGGYGPLYQAAYMLGALQFRQMHKELVQTAKMDNRQFHDAILKENSIPVELLRAKLTDQQLDKNWKPSWRFHD